MNRYYYYHRLFSDLKRFWLPSIISYIFWIIYRVEMMNGINDEKMIKTPDAESI